MSIQTGVGMISGLNFDDIISKLSEVNRRPIQLLQREQQVLNNRSEAYGTINSRLTALNDQLKNMQSREDFNFLQATASNDAVSVDAASDADTGSFSVDVLQLAQAGRKASQGVVSSAAPIAAAPGEFKIQVGFGVTRTYDVNASTTLSDLRDMINNDENSEVTASIINDGSSSNPYRLVLSSKTTGSTADVKIKQNDTTLNFSDKLIEAATADSGNQFDGTVTSSGTYTGEGTKNVVLKMVQGGSVDGGAKFVVSLDGGLSYGTTEYDATSVAQDISDGEGIEVNFGTGSQNFAVGDTFRIDAFDPTLQEAKDAIIRVDGIQISRSNNTFNDVIDGLTLTANEVSTSAAQVNVSQQVGLINAEVVKFREAFNGILQSIEDLASYNPETEQAGPLFGESGIRSLRSSLTFMITNPVEGTSGKYTTLNSVGLNLGPSGQLQFDSAKMNEVLEEDPEAIMRLFGRVGQSTNDQISISNVVGDVAAGTYRVNVTQAASKAQVEGNQALQSSGLAADENLTFTVGERTFVINLDAGFTTNEIVNQLNSRFADEGVYLEAENENGVLRIQSQEYGDAYGFKVLSDQNGGTNTQTGIGTTLHDVTGTDVEGTINGVTATGNGQVLTGLEGSRFEGLELTVTATSPTFSSISFTNGMANQLLTFLDSYLDPDTGVIQVRRDGISDSISGINDRIQSLQERIDSEAERMRAKFIAMESTLLKYQGMGDYVANSLSQMGTTG